MSEQHPGLPLLLQKVGEAVTAYQSLEDHLSWTFISAMSNHACAGAVFTVIRGLETKLEIIETALQDPTTRSRFTDLAKKIKRAQALRNRIAHSVAIIHDTCDVIYEQSGTGGYPVISVIVNSKPGYVALNKGSFDTNGFRLSDVQAAIDQIQEVGKILRDFTASLAAP